MELNSDRNGVEFIVIWWARISFFGCSNCNFITTVHCVRRVFVSGCRSMYRGADNSLARPISRCILFDGGNISFDARLVMYINSTNIPPIVVINRMYEHQNLRSL
jgi:hypothetical protein